jgi:MFS family permease
MVAEMVPEKELQPRAFSIMPLVWSLGSIFGPSFGGFFAKPVENLPGLFGHSKFLAEFPFALPNIVASMLFLMGISTGILFLKVCFFIIIQCQSHTNTTRKPSKLNATGKT